MAVIFVRAYKTTPSAKTLPPEIQESERNKENKPMSTMICIKEGDTIVLGTDSRFMLSDFSAISNDAVQKLFEIAPGAFLATCGWSFSSDFLAQKDPELVQELNSRDIRILAAALDQASRPCLQGVLNALSTLPPNDVITETLSGRRPIQGFILAGLSDGKLGFINNQYYFRDGQVVLNASEYFDRPRCIQTLDTPASKQIQQDPTTWTDNPVRVMLKILRMQKRASPLIGGPSQVALIDSSGGRWVNRPPAAAMSATQPACATITASVSMTAPDLTVTNASFVAKMNPTDGFKITGNNLTVLLNNQVQSSVAQALVAQSTANNHVVQVSPDGGIALRSNLGSGISFAQLSPNALSMWDNSSGSLLARIITGSGDANLSLFGPHSIVVNSFDGTISIDGLQVLAPRYSGSVSTLADVIAVLRHMGLCS